jgi:hypothetical protein
VDDDFMLAAAEYRFPLWRDGIDWFLFYELGRVYESAARYFDIRHLRYSVGGGIRIWSSERETARIFIGYGREGWRVYIETGALW